MIEVPRCYPVTDESPENILRSWAKAYRQSPEHRFPSDPDAEFFPVDLERGADEIERQRAALMEVRKIANGEGNPRTIIAKIFDIATRGSRGEPLGLAQTEKPCGEPVAWQYRELPNGIWHHCDIVTDNPRLEYRALCTSPAPSSWQPIETAPKDGTWFVALQNGETYPCEWREEQPDEGRSHKGWFDLFNSSFEEPTQWSPAGSAITSATLPDAGTIDWKMEAERANRLLVDAKRIIAEYKASTIAGAKADVAAHGMPGARGQATASPTEHAALIERITNITTWLREPDWTEEASLEWLMEWMDRRPIAELAMVAMLMPGPVVTSTVLSPAARPTVIGKVSGKVREADQCPGMPHAICHACGLGYKCDDIDCPNTNPNPMFGGVA